MTAEGNALSPERLLLDIDAAAFALDVSPSTVRRMVADGALPVVRLGRATVRFRRADIEAIVNGAR